MCPHNRGLFFFFKSLEYSTRTASSYFPRFSLNSRFWVQPRLHTQEMVSPEPRMTRLSQAHMAATHNAFAMGRVLLWRAPLMVLHVCLAKRRSRLIQIIEIIFKVKQMDDLPPCRVPVLLFSRYCWPRVPTESRPGTARSGSAASQLPPCPGRKQGPQAIPTQEAQAGRGRAGRHTVDSGQNSISHSVSVWPHRTPSVCPVRDRLCN